MTTETQDTGTASTDAGGTQTAETQAATTAATTDATSTETKTETTAEVEYKFDAPEGVELNKDDLSEFTAIAKELKLPLDGAKKLVDLAAKREIARAEAFAKQVQDWGEQVKADKELGTPENLAIAKKAIDTFGTPELRDMLNATGLGNHPEVVKLALKIGKAISEDAIATGRSGGNAPPRDAASILYGKTTP